ncbi:MAG: hypothetical protein RLZ98_1108 [Pseudomonadota bacterium]|jgi:hypothetical protein
MGVETRNGRGLVKHNWISLALALAAAAFVLWANATRAFGWLDPITALLALGGLAVIIAIDIHALLKK